MLAGCQTPEPPPAPPSGGSRAASPAVRPLPTPPPPVAPPAEGAWSFSSTGGSCTARITHADAGLTVTAGPEARVGFTLRGARGARIAFSGPDGGWNLRGAPSGGGVSAEVPLAAGEGRVRQLLGGGSISLPGARQPALRFPEAGVSGREWFGCLSRLPRA
jgi:hypothetical protein